MNNREENRCRFLFLYFFLIALFLSKGIGRFLPHGGGEGGQNTHLDILTLTTCFLSFCLLDVRNENGTINK